jgi:hypothetical protein
MLKPMLINKGSQTSAMTAFSVAQDAKKESTAHGCMLLHGHLHQLHAGSPGVAHTTAHNPQILT